MSTKLKTVFLALAIFFVLGISFLFLNKNSETWTLKDYKSQELNWRDCYDGYQCSSFKVPVDYEKITDQSFNLKVLRHRATDTKNRVGALLVNPGGPGGSATDYAFNAESIVSSKIYKRYDIVGFDPRGVGRSAPIRWL